MKDLFDTPELLPVEVQDILTEWEENAGFYDNCKILVEKLNAVGYTCDYDLSAEVFGLRKLKTKGFTTAQNKVLTEIYRRLNYFHNGDLNTNLLFLGYPSDAKVISELGLIKPSSKELPRVLNWYNLTEKGKKFFAHYVTGRKLSENENHNYFTNSHTKIFDAKYLTQ